MTLSYEYKLRYNDDKKFWYKYFLWYKTTKIIFKSEISIPPKFKQYIAIPFQFSKLSQLNKFVEENSSVMLTVSKLDCEK